MDDALGVLDGMLTWVNGKAEGLYAADPQIRIREILRRLAGGSTASH
jgi:hypothetical protein